MDVEEEITILIFSKPLFQTHRRILSSSQPLFWYEALVE